MKDRAQQFWSWYEQHYALNVGFAAGLFILQLIHLYWLTADVVLRRLTGISFFPLSGIPHALIITIDYTEIPALLATSFIYIDELRHRFSWKSAWFLFFLNTQWLHLFWITDEFVLNQFRGKVIFLPVWLAWIAILIDYLELPVIFDTIKKFIAAMNDKRLKQFVENDI